MTVPAIRLPEVGAVLGKVDVELYDDPEQAAVAIAQEILNSQSAQDVLRSRETVPAAELLDIPIEVTTVRFNRSDFDQGPSLYALMRAIILETGEVVIVTCGGRNVLAQLYRLCQLEALPTRVRITRAKRATSAGYNPLWLIGA